MSDNWLQLVPKDPCFRPSPDVAERARQLLASFVPRSDEVLAEAMDAIEFFDPGSNWSGVACPACGADLEGWWHDTVDSKVDAGFESLMRVVGCCGAEVSLNDLRFAWPAAFGSFALIAENPEVEDLSDEQRAELEAQLGCELRTVWARI